MRAQVSDWFGDNIRTYFGNATSTRDYRVQMRGSKSVLFFSLYLGLLVTVAWFVYTESVRTSDASIVQAQQALKNFYDLLLGALGFIVSVVPPVMAATSVIAEKQRRSFDLVFSAPVSAKYYLVGKLISSFRYTWMLLVLALPVTAACVVLGGASWTDVLSAYFMLSVIGVVISSLALACSSMTTQPVQAAVMALVVSLAYNVLSGGFGAMSLSSYRMGAHANEMPFYSLFSPFFVGKTATTTTEWFGMIHVPNVIPATIGALLISKFVLTCSGVHLMPYRKQAAAGVRWHCLIYACALAGLTAYSIGPATATMSHISYTGTTLVVTSWDRFAVATSMFVFVLSLASPIACYTLEGENRLKPNGVFNFKNAFDGTPAGHLPFFLLLTVSIFASVALGNMLATTFTFPGLSYWTMMIFSCGLWVFGWGAARLTSSITRKLTQAQGLALGLSIAIMALPVPLFTMLTEPGVPYSRATVWDLYILRPLGLIDEAVGWRAMPYAMILITAGSLMAWSAMRRTARQASRPKEAKPSAA